MSPEPKSQTQESLCVSLPLPGYTRSLLSQVSALREKALALTGNQGIEAAMDW